MTRTIRIAGPASLVIVAFAAVLAALAYGGGADAPVLLDPGAVVRYGLPIAKLVVNLGMALTLGTLVLALFALSPDRDEYAKALDIASAGAALYTIASGVTAFFTFLSVTGTTFAIDDAFGQKMGFFFTDVELGQAWLQTTLVAAAVTVLCFAVRNQTGLFFVTALALVSLLPLAQQGHAAGTSGHDSAVTALGLHMMFAAVWLGGLLALVLLKPSLDGVRLVAVLRRYSTLALIAFVVVAVSGYASASLRIGTWDQLFSQYGVLVIVKVVVLLCLGLFGAFYRTIIIGRMPADAASGRGTASLGPDGARRSRLFWALAVAELAFMGIASGVAAALARTATPVVEEIPDSASPAVILTGDPVPAQLVPTSLLTQWNVDLIWLLVCCFGIVLYIAGVIRLRRRGDAWPVLRTISWVLGLVLLLWLTCGPINVYQKYLFSIHMLGHMGLTMAVPLLLVPGAPVTLAMRAIRKRSDGSRGPREWILLAVHSRFAGVLSNGVVAAVLFAGSLWVFYYSPLFRWSMEDHIGHEWMTVHFLITGFLFVNALIGIDPGPPRLGYPMRLLLLLATMAAHAFFGLAIMSNTGLFLADWFGAMGRTWGSTPLEDQYIGGGIAWSVGEIPTLALAIVVAIQWSRDDTRQQKRLDRREDRTDDERLRAYNAELARLAEKDAERG